MDSFDQGAFAAGTRIIQKWLLLFFISFLVFRVLPIAQNVGSDSPSQNVADKSLHYDKESEVSSVFYVVSQCTKEPPNG